MQLSQTVLLYNKCQHAPKNWITICNTVPWALVNAMSLALTCHVEIMTSPRSTYSLVHMCLCINVGTAPVNCLLLLQPRCFMSVAPRPCANTAGPARSRAVDGGPSPAPRNARTKHAPGGMLAGNGDWDSCTWFRQCTGSHSALCLAALPNGWDSREGEFWGPANPE